MFTIATDWEIPALDPTPLAMPHAWLGLAPDDTEPAVIMQAARRRLEAIRDAYGSEEQVKEVLVTIIVTARQEMLSRARET